MAATQPDYATDPTQQPTSSPQVQPTRVTFGPNDVANQPAFQAPDLGTIGGSLPPTSATTTTPQWNSGGMDMSQYDPRLVALFKQYNMTPTGRGTGNTDIAYWNDKMASGDANYFLGRLGADFAGTGMDTPAGRAGSAGSGFLSLTGNTGFQMPGMTPQDPRLSGLFDQLLGRSRESLQVNPNDPIIAGQVNAFRNEQMRNMRNSLSDIASASGPNANIGAETRMANENVGQQTASFQAQAMQRELDARRQEVAQALQLAVSQGNIMEASRLREYDQQLAAQSLGLTAQQQGWAQAFQDRGWNADQAQRAWTDQYNTLFG